MNIYNVKHIFYFMSLFVIVSSCSTENDQPDAYGNFETREVIISSESAGRLLAFYLNEGDIVEKGQVAGIIDTSLLHLQYEQLLVQKDLVKSKIANLNAQKEVTLTALQNIMVEKKRLALLLKDKAATQKQMDEINGKIDVINKQLELTDVQISTIKNEIHSVDKQIAMVRLQLSKCKIENTVNGTILEKYVEEGEVVGPGKSLYKVAPLNILFLKVYVSEVQLSSFAIGDSVMVYTDAGKKNLEPTSGVVTWVSSNAEFTPKMVQTKEERVNLVYAVKIAVNNNGKLKIGMPGEVKF